MLLLLALVFHIQLPQPPPRDPQLVFRAYFADFEVLVDGRRVYDFHDLRAADRMTIHVVPLRPGKQVEIRVRDLKGDPYFGGEPLIVARDRLPDALREMTVAPMRNDFGDMAAGALILVLGLVAIAASQLLRRGDTRMLLSFGLFAALYGLRLLVESHLPYVLGVRAHPLEYVSAWITYVINIPGWALARRLAGDGWQSSLKWQLYAFILFAPVAIASDLWFDRASALEPVNNVLVVVGGANVLLNLLFARRWRSLELRVVLLGTCVFVATAFANNLSSLGLVTLGGIDETIGFLAFLLALGFAATRSFLTSERARVALDNELATAREIQQSILPTSMPDVAGLRFAAHYDPASTVAGDLYDFLRVDDRRAGAIVADVSGHGIPAALVASMMKVAVSSQSPLADRPAELLRAVNRTLRGQVRRVFVTATYLFFTVSFRSREDGEESPASHSSGDSSPSSRLGMTPSCVVEVANAGHPAPLLHRGGEVRELGPHGVVLGRFDTAYASETIALQPGDRIVAYTDGVTEALNARGEAFGEARLHAAIRGGAGADEIARAVRAWRDPKQEADDVTLLVVDVLPSFPVESAH